LKATELILKDFEGHSYSLTTIINPKSRKYFALPSSVYFHSKICHFNNS